ncbi:metallophosphoesterase [Cumulibacter manganitolerans]|uniref:metallophosphoesterase n=1 Tax=Cumulibacter manganitolerans TaxID=1884992 RepID=UPI001E521469|nr:metallophosphoesterase [Cumulibacter manganitolerans]
MLQLADLHVTPQQRRKVAWVRSLADLAPDLVLSTGDHLGGDESAFENSLRAHEPFLHLPGAFVWGNNDHWAPVAKSPTRYFTRTTVHRRGHRLDLTGLREGLTAHGWLDLNNRRGSVQAGGLSVALAGVDDPHTRRDRYAAIAGAADRDADVRIALTHSPEPRVLDPMVDDGYDLVLAGHTHGGQVRIPMVGAAVTNCGIDRSRVRWMSDWTSPSGRTAPLHVSAGLGTSPYAPVRFCCRPEATLLTLIPRPA